ncbi:hypothetical protein ABAC460_01135 [Asticcacaulis sp. AC460]|uniref:hypothetical protein n=1 Tax=Asticcacaulis sp. AC460 TaxID=1282360 RepID=UPI0003C3D3CA|nr:hypothetical protein [Asticcacaulis sp. AC460]ESQ93338.1 hypothetical protein ABAC460_01135 [Asticcacaulis sp. AC460]
MKRSLFALFTLGLLAISTSAFAAAEDLHQARDGDTNCSAPHEKQTHIIWKAGQGTIRLLGKGTERLEMYGHGIDLSPSVSIPDIPGASATKIESRNGAVNGARGCGNIGSIVFDVTMGSVSSARNGTLKIGSETFPIRAIPVLATEVEWDENDFGNGASMTLAEKQANDARVLQAAVNRCQQRINSPDLDNSCAIVGFFLTTTRDQACAQFRAMGASCDFEHSFQARETGADFRGTLVNCGDEHGVKSELTASDPPTLTVTLPVIRDGAIFTCLTKPLILSYRRNAPSDVDLKFSNLSVTHTLSQTPSAGAPRLGFSDAARNSLNADFREGSLTLSQATWHDLVGVYTYDLDVSPASETSKVRLVIQSAPGFGVQAAAAPVFNPNLGRMNSTYAFGITPIQPTKAGQTFDYQVTGQPAGVSCFTQSSGSVTPGANLAVFKISLTVNEVAGCINRQMTMTVTAGGTSMTDDRFGERITFTIPSKSTINPPPETAPSPVIPGTVRINP